jgi:hypothetical protein
MTGTGKCTQAGWNRNRNRSRQYVYGLLWYMPETLRFMITIEVLIKKGKQTAEVYILCICTLYKICSRVGQSLLENNSTFCTL